MSLSRNSLVLLALCLCCAAIAVQAAVDVRVVGLFSDRAVLLIDGQQRLLSPGQTSPEGVKLISATSEGALLLIDGQEVNARLDGRVSAGKRSAVAGKPDSTDHSVTGDEVQVWRDTSGMYTTVGSINGLPVPFLVDTGATTIAMNAKQAKRLGIDYRVVGTQSAVTTASGIERVWSVKLDTVKVGELLLRNVDAVVLEGAFPATTLLGMSFLGRLEIDNDGRLMTLRKRY